MSTTKPVLSRIAPAGKLRASINLGNPVLASRHPDNGAPFGVSVDLAEGFARELGVELETVVFNTAGRAAEAIAAGEVDIGFLAIDPGRADGIDFAPPYVQIEGSYLVRNGSPLQSNSEVDAAGKRVVVGKGSAYDLYLTRALQHAEIVRAPTSQAVVGLFLATDCDVAAGVRQQLEADAQRVGGLRLLPGRFMVINQAVGIPKGRGAEALALLVDYVERMKASGFVAAALKRHGIAGAAVAPAGYGSD